LVGECDGGHRGVAELVRRGWMDCRDWLSVADMAGGDDMIG